MNQFYDIGDGVFKINEGGKYMNVSTGFNRIEGYCRNTEILPNHRNLAPVFKQFSGTKNLKQYLSVFCLRFSRHGKFLKMGQDFGNWARFRCFRYHTALYLFPLNSIPICPLHLCRHIFLRTIMYRRPTHNVLLGFKILFHIEPLLTPTNELFLVPCP